MFFRLQYCSLHCPFSKNPHPIPLQMIFHNDMLSDMNVSKGTPFSMKFVKAETGEIINADNVVMTSSNFERRTRNIMFLTSEEIRTVSNILITEYNGQPVYY